MGQASRIQNIHASRDPLLLVHLKPSGAKYARPKAGRAKSAGEQQLAEGRSAVLMLMQERLLAYAAFLEKMESHPQPDGLLA